MRIEKSIVVVTGASFGIGRATARAMAARGARVALLARTEPALQAVAAEIAGSGGTAHVYPVDLTDPAAVDQVARRIMAEVGTPDIIVHSAGAGRWLFVEETAPAEAMAMMAAPYFAAFYVTHAFLPAMLRRGRGRIVTVGSLAARVVWPGATAYTAARWALHGFAEALRVDLHGTGLGVTLVMPGTVRSTYFAHNPGIAPRIPRISRLSRTVTPEEVAAAVVRGVERDRREVLLPFMLRVFCLASILVPRLVTWLNSITGYQHPRLKAPDS